MKLDIKQLKEEVHFAFQNRYKGHIYNAKRRGIEFKLRFAEWFQIWIDSGHWYERGRKSDQYCMARYGDKGAYEAGNVRIITGGENWRETKGRKQSEGECERKRRFMKEFYSDPNNRKKTSDAVKAGSHQYRGQHLSAEHRAKIGKSGKGKNAGEEHGNSCLSNEQAYRIKYQEIGTHQSIADKYGISRGVVGSIKTRKRWQHI